MVAMLMFILATVRLITNVYAGKQGDGGAGIKGSGSSIQWPRGTYTLVKPEDGCPRGWKQGWRKQDNEDDNNSNDIISKHHFYGSFGKNIVLYYCTKDDHILPTSGYWPKGNYCIIRSTSSCPPGFKTGFIKWDDEDTKNINAAGGVLPSGTFDKNTLIDYCCRSDGTDSTPIKLPTSKPFYLLRYLSACQQVTGMRVREEWIKTDDENENNNNKQGNSHPNVTGVEDYTLYYCYYYR